MGRNNQGLARRHLAQVVHDLLAGCRIQVGRGFIDQPQACMLLHSHARQPQSYGFTTRQALPCFPQAGAVALGKGLA